MGYHHSKRNLNWIVSTLLILLISCGKENDNADASISEKLNGLWQTACLNAPDALKAKSLKYEALFQDSTFKHSETSYEDTECQVKAETEEIFSTFLLGDLIESTYNFDYTLTKLQETYFSQNWIDSLNDRGDCDITDRVLNEPVDLARCGITGGFTVHSIIKAMDREIKIGRQSSDRSGGINDRYNILTEYSYFKFEE